MDSKTWSQVFWGRVKYPEGTQKEPYGRTGRLEVWKNRTKKIDDVNALTSAIFFVRFFQKFWTV